MVDEVFVNRDVSMFLSDEDMYHIASKDPKVVSKP